MQTTDKREVIITNTPQQVYGFLKDPRNYLGGVDGVSVDSGGASFSVPSFGRIRADITNLIQDQKIVIYSKDINTSLTANLQEMGQDKTKVTLSVVSKPDCGLFKNLAIRLAIPKLLDAVIESFKTTEI
jgi:hypothetical protein